MAPFFRRTAFDAWVPEFIARSNALSGVGRPPTEAEVAAHRGLFARRDPGAGQVAMFHAHACGGPGSLDPGKGDRMESLLSSGLAPSELHDRILSMIPFSDGNGRCARALWMWALLRDGLDPDVEGVPAMPAEPTEAGRRTAE